jgi:PAS domain S-box-containing protein
MDGGAGVFSDGESGEIFRLLVASVVDYAIYLLDRDGHIRTWNEGARRIKGYEAGEVLGRHFALFYTPEDARDGKPVRGLGAALAEGRWEDEGWRVRKDGTRFWASVVLTALRDGDGRLVGVAKVTRDLTARRRAEEERAQLLAEEQAARAAAAAAEAALRERDTFLAVAAHELRTPMTALWGAVQLMQRQLARGTPNPAALAAQLGRLDRTARRLAALTEELLDVARLRTGQLPLARAPLDPAALVGEAVRDARDGVEERHQITLAVGDALPPVAGDAARLGQVLANLLDNAAKYSPDGGTIAVHVGAAEGGVRVAVRDEGIGLPPGSTEAIFAPFGRAANALVRQLPGLGLGLHICREIVARHGGRLWAESAGEGRGATFVLWLPADEARSFPRASGNTSTPQ